MQDALIGHTGLVGSALARQHRFGRHYNSKNVSDLDGERFDTVLCAAAPGSMVTANRAPERDTEIIDGLMASLGSFRARRFVLISTIAVLDRPDRGQDETTDDFENELAYGRNRRRLETFCATRFPDCVILRLPALYGPGLKKNFLFDILNPVPSMLNPAAWERVQTEIPARMRAGLVGHFNWDPAIGMHVLDRPALSADPRRSEFEAALAERGMTALQFTNPESTFQYYGLHRLWGDIQQAVQAGLAVAHMAVEPLRAADVYRHLTGGKMPESTAKMHHEDFRTRHEAVFGGQNGYIQTSREALNEIGGWIEQERCR